LKKWKDHNRTQQKVFFFKIYRSFAVFCEFGGSFFILAFGFIESFEFIDLVGDARRTSCGLFCPVAVASYRAGRMDRKILGP